MYTNIVLWVATALLNFRIYSQFNSACNAHKQEQGPSCGFLGAHTLPPPNQTWSHLPSLPPSVRELKIVILKDSLCCTRFSKQTVTQWCSCQCLQDQAVEGLIIVQSFHTLRRSRSWVWLSAAIIWYDAVTVANVTYSKLDACSHLFVLFIMSL